MIAIVIGARELINIPLANKTINIFSTSQAELKTLSFNRVDSNLVWNCMNTLERLDARNTVTLILVTGHIGVEPESFHLLERYPKAKSTLL